MKVIIGDYEVNITVKDTYDKRAGARWTKSFLNELSLDYIRLAEHFYSKHKTGDADIYDDMAKSYQKKAREIFRQLAAIGYYNDVK